MSVNIVAGLTGSGKTFFVTNYVLPLLDKKLDTDWKFKANYHIDANHLSRKVDFFSDPMEIVNFRKCVVLIDDAPIWFGSRQWSRFPVELQDLIVNNRKNGLQVWATCQFFESIDRTIRENCHGYWECKKAFGSDEYAKNPWGLIVARKYPPRMYDKIRRKHLDKQYLWINKKRTSVYDTYEVVTKPEDYEQRASILTPSQKRVVKKRIKAVKKEVEKVTDLENRRIRLQITRG